MERQVKEKWIQGDELLRFIRPVKTLKSRYVLDKLYNHINESTYEICALYGLRRTGKTVLMKQCIVKLLNDKAEINEIAFITFRKKTGYADTDLINDIEELVKNGIKYIFIDEISYINMELEDNSLNILSDVYGGMGIKIVIAGTFSYAIKLLSNDVLFDRVYMINTTYFSFKEANEVFGMNLDEFIMHGGIIRDKAEKPMKPRDYMKTAIVDNIINSLMKSDKLYDIGYLDPEIDLLIDKKDVKKLEHRLSVLIKRVIDQYLKLLMLNKITREPYKYSDIGNLSDLIRQRSQRENEKNEELAVISLDKSKYYEIIARVFGELDRQRFNKEIFQELIKILKQIGVIEDIQLQSETVSCFITNYIRFGLCDEIMKQIDDEVRKETGDRYTRGLADENLKGHILEGIVYLDLKHMNSIDFDMHRNADNAEVDLIIKDHESKEMDIYEIKHTPNVTDEQCKNLLNRDFILEMERDLGFKVRTVNIIYTGEPQVKEINPVELYSKMFMDAANRNKENLKEKYRALEERAKAQKWEAVKIQYINAEHFLKNLDRINKQEV